MTYTYALDARHSETLEAARALVGGKAANLGVMIRELDLPVPPGFAITTETCRTFLASGWPAGLDDEIRERMSEVEAKVGRRFGDASDPLLVSVRSGAPVSMPGMMDTILNLGLNDGTTAGLAQGGGGEAFARACRERFVESFRSIVGTDPPGEPSAQLRLAVEAVFRSWNSDRAIAYRRREGIPDDLGTAVTVQAMVFGNRGPTSATGVVFTRNPATGEPRLYGDILFDAQGEDVVAGTHDTQSIEVLDERMPTVAAELREYAERLERHYADLCDIEFTIEDGRLWLLQVRVGKRSQQAALRIAVDMAEDPGFPLTRAEAVERVLPLLANPPRIATAPVDRARPLFTGLPASPGVASGPIALTSEAALTSAEAGRAAILVRAETSPEDVPGMAKAAGILTSKGGLASHAAVVARGWGIPAVVGATELHVGENEATVGDRTLRAGEVITIDGSTGGVFEGVVEGATQVAPEADIVRGWARELGAEPSGDPVGTHASSRTIVPDRHVLPDECLRAIAIKGFAPAQGLADALLVTPERLHSLLDQLAQEGLVLSSAGAYRLSDAGAERARMALEGERSAWGAEAASAALDRFVALDKPMKEIVTAWQLRDDVEGQPINDHADADYDNKVLDRLAGLHADAVDWLTPIEAECPRLAGYRLRLDRAMDRARAGDNRFVASPRVDSYHSIWFELHEDLIQLAGRSREEEVAAGRA